MPGPSESYRAAEEALGLIPIERRGSVNDNPPGISFWALVAEDWRTHGRTIWDQGFWAVFCHRFGNWRMGQPKAIRAPCTLLYRTWFKLVEVFAGVSLWYTVRIGRRVRIWHHSGIVISARAIGDDSQIRQNTTMGVKREGPLEIPIIGARVDIGAGACVVGPVVVGDDARIGANAVVARDVPAGGAALAPATTIRGPRG